eukprot:6210510-Prymnesium_polylepis.1
MFDGPEHASGTPSNLASFPPDAAPTRVFRGCAHLACRACTPLNVRCNESGRPQPTTPCRRLGRCFTSSCGIRAGGGG